MYSKNRMFVLYNFGALYKLSGTADKAICVLNRKAAPQHTVTTVY